MAAARAAAASRARRAARSAGGARRTRPAAAAAAIPPQQPPQVVLFDLDGVLYDAPRTGYLEDVKRRQVEFIVERLGVPRADAPALQQEAFALANQTARGLQRMGFAFESKEFVAYCRQGGAPKYLKPDDEVIEAVRALSVPALVFTNTGEREAEVCLECLGLDEPGLFQGIVGSDSYSEPKPNRAAFEVALGRAGLSLEEAHRAVLFEDSAKNAAAAKSLGLYSVLVTETAERQANVQERAEAAHAVIDRISIGAIDALGLGLYDA